MRYFRDIEMLEDQVFGSGSRPEDEDFPDRGQEEEFFPEEAVPVMMTMTMEDGRETRCRVDGIFLCGDKEYIALETEESEILILELLQGEDGDIRLQPVEGEEEQERVIETYMELLGEDQEEMEYDHDGDQNREEN